MTIALGTLSQIDVRDVWKHEALAFTPWLAGQGLVLLGEALGMELEVVATEQAVGPFKADIVARRADGLDEHLVLIENQLERTDHLHLGQLLTYAAGLKVATIVWVARTFTDEHRAALDWLNDITGEHFEFYGVEIELWSINGSVAAPKFNLAARPNDWSKSVKAAASGAGGVSDLKLLQQEYWEALRQRLLANKGPVTPQAARPQHWAYFSIGRARATLAATVNKRLARVTAALEFSGPMNKHWFQLLLAQRPAVEEVFGAALVWDELPERQSARIGVWLDGVDPLDRAQWPSQHAWLEDTLGRMKQAFAHRVKALPDDTPGVVMDER